MAASLTAATTPTLEALGSAEFDLYRNLNRGGWSIRLHGGRVVGHVAAVVAEGCRFVVRESGRKRVLRDKQRNVHAWVIGRVIALEDVPHLEAEGWVRVTYSPYREGYFT